MRNEQLIKIGNRDGVTVTLKKGLLGDSPRLLVGISPDIDKVEASIQLELDLSLSEAAMLVLESTLDELLGDLAQDFIAGIISSLEDLDNSQIK